MNALKPTTPRSAISAMSGTEPGTSPPHSAKSVIDEASSAARLRSNSPAFTVHGVELSGMSKNSRAAAGRERPAAGGRAFPLGPARFVEVHVHVDDAGQHVQAAGVDLVGAPPRRPVTRRGSGRPRSPRRPDAAVGRDERAAADHEVDHAQVLARSSRTVCADGQRGATSASTHRSRPDGG